MKMGTEFWEGQVVAARLKSGSLKLAQCLAGWDFAKNPMKHFCRLFKRTQSFDTFVGV